MTPPAHGFSRKLPFTKATAYGNDFLIVHSPDLNPGDLHSSPLDSLTRALCDRHNGIGADGVEWLFPATSPAADIEARLFNADGSAAELSGNGTRCVAAYWIQKHGGKTVSVLTGAGVKRCTLLGSQAGAGGSPKQDGSTYAFEMEMGVPVVSEPRAIHLAIGEITGVPVSMGNPHFVLFVDEFLPGWQALAAEIGRNRAFEHGTNVELVHIENTGRIGLRIFERGVGETQSSGTGSCAAAVAAISSRLASSPLEVVAPGGAQQVRWEGGVFLSGSARLICSGEFFV